MPVRLTFRTKLMGIVGIAAVAFLLLIAASTLIASRVEHQLETIQRRYLPRVELEPQLEAQLERIGRGFQDAVAARDTDALLATRELVARFFAQLAAAGDAVDPAEASALRSAVEDYYAAAHDVSLRLIAGETGETLVDAMTAMQAKQAAASEQLRKTAALERGELAEAFAATARAQATAGRYRLWISVACLGSAVLLCLTLSRGLLRSVAELRAGFLRFGRGDFGTPIRSGSRDELGDLAGQANQMAADLESLTVEHRKAEEKFRGLLEAAPDAMVIADVRGRIVLVNAQTEKLFGYRRDELLDRGLDVLVPKRLRSELSEHRTGYLYDPAVSAPGSGAELYASRKDGVEFPIEISTSPLQLDTEVLVSSAIRDITERRKVEIALKSSNRELDAFSYSVAHDLRAPLRGMNGFSRALLEDYGDKLDDEGKDYLQRICSGAERMGHLIDGLLALSRVTRTDLEREEVNMSRLAEGIVTQLRVGQPDRMVEFKNQDDVVAHGDPRLLRALLENLLGNAWKFTGTRPSACIEFGAAQRSGAMEYFVKDDGAGFDMAYADKLFTAFQRLHSADEFAGTGIGLATVHRIVSRHGGRVWATGAVNGGATFHFTLENAGVRNQS
jgi:PAS domain S-box-containing protein